MTCHPKIMCIEKILQFRFENNLLLGVLGRTAYIRAQIIGPVGGCSTYCYNTVSLSRNGLKTTFTRSCGVYSSSVRRPLSLLLLLLYVYLPTHAVYKNNMAILVIYLLSQIDGKIVSDVAFKKILKYQGTEHYTTQ